MARILVIDDDEAIRLLLRAVLECQGYEVVEAENGYEGLLCYHAKPTDLVITDLDMPVMDGLEALREIMQRRPVTKVIIFTVFDSDERILAAVQSGAQGYLLKGDAPRNEVFRAVRTVYQGGALLQPVVAGKLLRQVKGQAGHPGAFTPGPEELTEREQEVLELMGQGLANKEIAQRLVISERTVKFHVSGILAKLGAGNRTEATRLAAQRGLIKL
jgi:DNA-binding NarL/FixJ family response regulator